MALYLVATPIGNLEDITLRALRVLKEVDLIACEDTRHTRKLLSHYGISRPTVSYHEHNERQRAVELVEKLKTGVSVALVSDAGTPLVSDPGFRLVRQCVEQGIQVIPVPGPSALTAALSASGLSTSEFIFGGFLPPRRAQRKAKLGEMCGARATLIFYEAPHRIKETLADALEVLGDRQGAIARELTKVHEELRRGRLSELEADLAETTVKGELVLLIGPPLDDNLKGPVPQSILEQVEQVMRDERIDQKSALKRVARLRRISKSEAYRQVMAERDKNH
jgi:16S rRNA (cytidine1402-2'-O)-methyltransferase